MASKLEGARDYLVSVAERTFGIDAYRKWQRYAENTPNINFTDPFTIAVQGQTEIGRKIGGAIVLLSQIAFPAGADYIARASSLAESPDSVFGPGYLIFQARYGIERMAAEGISWIGIMPAVVHNPVEFVLYKLGANVVTHVGLDILEAGINRIPKFRPPTTATFAV